MKSRVLAATVLTLSWSAASPASAEVATAHWDSFFYAAPRDTARILDEVQDQAKLDVQRCDGGWCRARYGEAEGYVREFVVHGPANELRPESQTADEKCFDAAQPGGATWQSEQFCR